MNKITLTMEKAGQTLTIQTEESEVSIGDYNIRFNQQGKVTSNIKKPVVKQSRAIGFKSSKD